MRSLIMICAALIAAPAAALAEPATGPTTASVTVRLSDLALSAPAGAQTALQRIDQAARRACGGDVNIQPDLIRQSTAFHRCRAAAVAGAIAQAQQPAIARAYAQRRTNLVVAGR